MLLHKIWNWDDAYANGPNIPSGDAWPQAWVEPARCYREALTTSGRARLDLRYGTRPRNQFDLFLPEAEPAGLVIFVHGGFWLRLDKTFWSHLSLGAVKRGYAVAIPSYSLCPEVRVSDITEEIGRAIEAAAGLVSGPLHLAGHSAGGQLVTRMISSSSPLAASVSSRIVTTVSISGLHDLRPLLRTAMNANLHLDAAEAAAESPALLVPLEHVRLTCWVGAAERSEFVRQSALLANIWKGLGASTLAVKEPDRHHFNIIDGLRDPEHPMLRTLLAQ